MIFEIIMLDIRKQLWKGWETRGSCKVQNILYCKPGKRLNSIFKIMEKSMEDLKRDDVLIWFNFSCCWGGKAFCKIKHKPSTWVGSNFVFECHGKRAFGWLEEVMSPCRLTGYELVFLLELWLQNLSQYSYGGIWKRRNKDNSRGRMKLSKIFIVIDYLLCFCLWFTWLEQNSIFDHLEWERFWKKAV